MSHKAGKLNYSNRNKKNKGKKLNASKVSLIRLYIMLVAATAMALSAPAVSGSGYNEDVAYALGEYYLSFANEDLNAFLSWNYLNEYSKEAIKQKEKALTNLWKSIDIEEFDYFNGLTTDVDKQIAIAHYTLKYKIKFPDKTIDEEKNITTLLIFQYPDWKVVISGESNVIDGLLSSYINSIKAYTNTTGFVFENTTGNTSQKQSNNKEENKTGGSKEGSNDNNNNYDNNSKTLPTDIPKKEGSRECRLSLDDLNISSISIKKYVPENIYDLLIGNTLIELKIGKKSLLINVNDGKLKLIGNTNNEESTKLKPKYTIEAGPCTILAIKDGTISPNKAYEDGLIKLSGESFGNKIKLTLGKIAYSIFSFFKGTKMPKMIILEGESFQLENAGKYSFTGKTSRGPGELYLGTGGSKATKEFSSDNSRDVYVYIKISDDKLHKDGSRSAEIYINNEKLAYRHVSENTITQKSAWAWKYLGKAKISKGKNKIVILKPKQTSAAFIMDKIALAYEKVDASEIED